jgi:site-specific DNA-methyltransferase (adenine-specific)
MKKKPFLTAGMFTSRTDEWATPAATYAALDAEFGGFNLDPCSTNENARCKKHYTKEDDGLTKDWSGHRVFVNPPYGRAISAWIKKCSDEAKKPGTTVVALLPARTDTSWFHDHINGKAREIRFVRGRLHFNESKSAAPFTSMIVVF